MIRVLVVDDHGVVRLGVERALSGLPGVEVVGAVADGEQALAAVPELEPDVILMDLQMPGLDGIAATREIVRQQPDARVVVLTSYLDRAKIEAALEAFLGAIESMSLHGATSIQDDANVAWRFDGSAFCSNGRREKRQQTIGAGRSLLRDEG